MFVWRWAVVLALARGLLPLAGTPPPPLPAGGAGPHVGFRCARSAIR